MLTLLHLAFAQAGDPENFGQPSEDRALTASWELLAKRMEDNMVRPRMHGEDDSAYGCNLRRSVSGHPLPDLLDIAEESEAPGNALQGADAGPPAAAAMQHSEDRMEAAERGVEAGSNRPAFSDPFEELIA